MRTIEDTDKYFEAGFPLEVPPIVLPWGKPLTEIAQATNPRWSGDRYFWARSTFLFGLEYALMSEVGISPEAPFTQITALIGLDLNSGLWSDQLSVHGFKEVGDHLINLLGNPTGQSSSSSGDGDYLSQQAYNKRAHWRLNSGAFPGVML